MVELCLIESVNGSFVMVKGLSFRRNFSWTFGGNLLYSIFQWLTLTLLVKFGTPEDLGQFGLASALVAPIVLFAGLQLRVLLATDAKNEYRFAEYLGLSIAGGIGALMLIFGLAICLGYTDARLGLITAVALIRILESIGEVYHGYFQKLDRMDRVAWSMALRGLGNVVLVALIYSLTPNILLACIAMAVWSLLVCVLLDVRLVRNIHHKGLSEPISLWPEFSRSRLFDLSRIAWPLGLVVFCTTLQINVPRYLLEAYRGYRELGIFVALSYVLVIGQTFVLALVKPATTTLSRYYAAGNAAALLRLLVKLEVVIAAVGALIILISMLFGRIILESLYTTDYAYYKNEFVILMIAGAVRYLGLVISAANTACRAIREQVVPALIELVVIAALGGLFIPHYGVLGAALALLGFTLVGLFQRVLVFQRALSKIDSEDVLVDVSLELVK